MGWCLPCAAKQPSASAKMAARVAWKVLFWPPGHGLTGKVSLRWGTAEHCLLGMVKAGEKEVSSQAVLLHAHLRIAHLGLACEGRSFSSLLKGGLKALVEPIQQSFCQVALLPV